MLYPETNMFYVNSISIRKSKKKKKKEEEEEAIVQFEFTIIIKM